MKNKLISSFFLLLTAIIWGFAFVAQVRGMESVGTFTFNGIRFTLGAVVMVPAFLIFSGRKTDRKKLKKSILQGLIGGLILFSAATLQQYAIEFSPDANSMKAGFITGLYTIIVPIAGFILFKRKTGLMIWIGVVAAVIGLYMLCAAGGEPLHITDIILFLSVPLWTAHILFIDHQGDSVDVFAFSCSQYCLCGALSFIGVCFFDRASFNAASIGGALLPIIYGGVFSVGVAYTLQFIGQKRADPTVAAIILSTESMFSAIGNLLILNARMKPIQYIGCLLIFAGIIISQLTFKRKTKHKKSDLIS